MLNNALKITERIKPTLIPALFENFDNAEIAILELIDNAIDDRIAGKTLEISIEVKEYSLSVTNRGGYGMGFEELDAFFAWGESDKKSSTGLLGRYGQGGKAAMGYLAKSCHITATKIGDDKEYIVEIEDWGDRKNGYVNADVIKRDSDEIESGLVKINLLGLKRRVIAGNLASTLSETYAPLLRSGEIKMWLNHIQVIGYNLYYEEDPTTVEFEILPGSGKYVTAKIGLIRPIKGLRGGFRCYEFDRLITKGEYFGQKTREDKYAFEKLAGEVFINFNIPLIMNKTNFNRSSEDWITLERIMYEKLDPWIKKLSGSRKEPSRVELSHQKNVNSAFEDFRIRQREKANDRIDKAEDDEDGSFYDNLVPNFKVEFKALDPTLRYQINSEEDGIKEILINLAYPAYKTWQKDIDLYIVDILVQELAKQKSESVEEYIKQYNIIFNELSKSFGS